MSVRSETNFCCLCLNTEVKFCKIDRNITAILKEFLGSAFLDTTLHKNICLICYKLLKRSLNFKKQCLEAKYLYRNMVHVSEKLLNMLHKLNFKPSLSQTKVRFLNIDASLCLLESNDPVPPAIEEVIINFNEEIVENESILDTDGKPNLTQTQVKFLNSDAYPSFLESIDPVTLAIKELKEDFSDEILRNECVLDEGFKQNLTQTQLNLLNVDVFPSLSESTDLVNSSEKLNAVIKEEIVENELLPNEDFKSNQTQTQAKFLNASTFLLKNNDEVTSAIEKLNEDFRPVIVRNEFIIDEKFNFMQELKDNILRDLNVVENEVVIEIDKRTPETRICLRDKVLDEEIYVKEGGPARKHTLNEVPQKTKWIKLDETTKDRNPLTNDVLKILPNINRKASDAGFSKKLSVASNMKMSKSKQITKSTVNGHKVITIAPKNNLKTQAKNATVQNDKTFDSKLSFNNVMNEISKQFLLKSVDVTLVPSTSLDRIDEEKKSNNYNKKGSENDFSCPVCHTNFLTKISLNVHLGVHIREKPYICDLCDYRCAHKDYLLIHIKRKHTEERNFSCDICEYRCVSKSVLDIHLRKHTGEKPYICDLCDRRFASKEYLKTHMRYKHTKEKKFSCHICQYKCVTKRALQLHLCTHTKERHFLCHICFDKFVTKGDLNAHLRVHTRDKRYICDLCNRRFAFKEYLIKHMKLVHTK